MNDKELLELAAKAAGIGVRWVDSWGDLNEWPKWNPLTDDGDALRLAMAIYMFDGSLFDLFKQLRLEETRLNCKRSDAEITRRAIVRAAAEIGKAMS